MRRAPRRSRVARTFVLSLAVALMASAAAQAAPADRAAPPSVPAEASIVVDAGSGSVIASDDAQARRPIASATKLMTALLTLERADLNDVFVAADYDAAPVESQIGLRPAERMAVRDLLVALLLESANDAAVTLAEGIAGSVEAFVADMNARAGRLGLDDTSYANPIGFDDPQNFSSAADLAELARRLMADPRFRDIVEEPSLALRSGDVPRVVENRNDLVGEEPSVDGVKTGHTLGAGHVLVGSAADADHRAISAVLGAPTEAARDAATLDLLDFGLDQLVDRRVLDAGEPLARAAVAGDAEASVPLAAARSATVTTIRGERVGTRVRAPDVLEGPLDEGERVGSVAVLQGGEATRRVGLVTAEAVPASGGLGAVADGVSGWLWAAIATAILIAIVGTFIFARARRRRARTTT